MGDVTPDHVVGSSRPSEETYRLRLISATFLPLFDPEPFTSRHLGVITLSACIGSAERGMFVGEINTVLWEAC
jgi:hypothetical protein